MIVLSGNKSDFPNRKVTCVAMRLSLKCEGQGRSGFLFVLADDIGRGRP